MNPTMIRARYTRALLTALVAAVLTTACSSAPQEKPRTPVAPVDPVPPTDDRTASKPVVKTPLDKLVREVTGDIHSQRIMYDSTPSKLADCSGMFLRAAGDITSRCRNLLAPTPAQARSSASIAQWYQNQGLYQPVSNALVQDHLIRPGMVLFYKRRSDAEISHMGLVTDVQLNNKGQVERYWLFHGRNRGKPAAITGYHYRSPRTDVPLGVGKKELVGAAKMCPQGECACAGTSAQAGGDQRVAPAQSVAQAPLLVASNGGLIGTGIASYYHKSLHGNKTASGEIYDHHGMSAAHRKLKFGTRVRVTRVDNGRSVEVRVNDRGPFVDGRIIDVSGAAAAQLDLLQDGLTEVRVERID